MTIRRPYKGISREEERDLVVRFQDGDRDAGAKLIEVHSGLIAGRVRVYLRAAEQFGIPFEDMMQEGRMGFLKGVERFDLSRRTRVTTYALQWVRAYVGNYVREQSGTIRVPNYIQDLLLGGRADDEDDKIMSARSVRNVLSLDRPANNDDGTAFTLLATLEETEPDAETQMVEQEQRATARAIAARGLRDLTPRERDVLQRRYMSEDPESLEQIGKAYALTRERIRQIEAEAKRRFRTIVTAAATRAERAVLPPAGSTPRKLVVRARPGRAPKPAMAAE